MVTITPTPAGYAFSGDATASDTPIINAFQPSDSALTLDLQALDIEDGSFMAAFTKWCVRQLQAGKALKLSGAPQLVVHNLYRVGHYPHPKLTIQDMRQDEAYG